MEKLKFIEFWKTGENPITCYVSRPTVSLEPEILKRPIRKSKNCRQAVTTIDQSGKKEEYESVVKAADALKIDKNSLYAFLNGHRDNPTSYQIFKSNLNTYENGAAK